MSNRKEIIEIVPGDRIHDEAFCTRPMTCPYCNGLGFFNADTFNRGDGAIACPDCGGTGEVKAHVTIEWKPNYPMV